MPPSIAADVLLAPIADDMNHRVAAVCYRHRSLGPEFLLVRTWDGGWTFPKGMVDPGHTETEAAEIEAWEEAGAQGAIEPQPFTTYRADKDGTDSGTVRILVTAYLLEVQETRRPLEEHRDPQWFAPADAKGALAEGRSAFRALEFARVIDLAVRRISKRKSG